MTENVCRLLDNLSRHNSRAYGYELSQNEVLQILKLFDDVKELEQYRAIGTVEQLKTMFDGFWKLKDLCEEYEKYGLPSDYWKLNEMCREYSAIGTIEDFKALKEKNEPSKVIEHETPHFIHWQCGNCGAEFYSGQKICDECGHPADWGDLLK